MNAKKCPVCDWEIKDPVTVKVGGKEVAVCCDECAGKLKESPAKYIKTGR
jgi:hypothetical protein